MTLAHDPSIWQGDGLHDYGEWYDMVSYFDITMPELQGWLNACTSEAWVREHLAKYEDTEMNLDIARYFWRRVEKLRTYIKGLESELDDESDSPVTEG